jgi:hypothetical protein
MSYLYPAPGTARDVQLWVQNVGNTAVGGNLVVPALQDVTINNANDVFTWTQLDQASKLQIATTATNSLDCNIVLDKTTFFGNGIGVGNVTYSETATAKTLGVFGLSKVKALVNFELFMGAENDSTSSNVTIAGQGYITGLAPATSADAPVFVSPITLTVTGDYTVIGNTAPKS